MNRTLVPRSMILVPASLVLVLLSACSGAPPGPPAPVRFGTTNSLDNMPFFVAEDRSLDKRNGISIQTKLYAGGTAILAALAASEVDAGTAGTVPMLDAYRNGVLGGPVVAVAANEFSSPQHPTGGVVVESSVKEWKDLEGAYIGVNTPLSLGGWAIVGRLKTEGVRQYHLVSIPFENMGLAVAGGSVRAAVIFEPYLTQSLQRKDGRLLDWVIGGAPLDRIQLSSVVFRRAFMEGSPGPARAFLRTYVQAVRWMLAHERDARAILGRGLSVSDRVAQTMILAEWRPDCRSDPGLLSSMQETLLGVGSITSAVRPESLFDETMLQAVQKDLK